MAEDVAKRAFDFYVSQGLAPHQAAAMVGHMMAESQGNPTIQETLKDGTKGPGYGAFQWTTPSRRAGLDAFAKSRPVPLDPNSLETQLLYSLHELDTSEADAGKKLYGAKTYQEAVDAGMHYLRPSGYKPDSPTAGHNYNGRYNFGAQYAGVAPLMGGAVAAAADSGAPPTPAPTAGLMAPSTPVDTTAAAAAVEKARKEKEQDEAYASITKTGLGLLGQAQSEGPKFMPAMEWNLPQVKPPDLPNYTQAKQPDFMEMLMQQRLQRRT